MPLLSGLVVYIFPKFVIVQQTIITNNMFKKLTFLLLVITVVSCKKSGSDANEKDKIKAAHWLLGKWEYKTPEGNLSETWKKVDDSTYNGQSYFIKAKDTIHFETITLQQKGEELTYTAIIKGQNNDKPVPFKLTQSTEKEMVFENPKHDYPQKITYKNVSKDNLIAIISGIQSGKPAKEQYAMKKSN